MIKITYKIFSVACLSILSVCANAAPGDLDTSFGNGGIVTTEFGIGPDHGVDIALQPDGKALVVGYGSGGTVSYNDIILLRYNIDGSLDTGFGIGGIATMDIEGNNDYGKAIVLQPDGKILIAGSSSSSGDGSRPQGLVMLRYNNDGSLDTGFGVEGIITMNYRGYVVNSQAISLQANGKILVTGGSYDWVTPIINTVLLRYNSDGSLDASFGDNGIVNLREQPAGIIVVQANGQILLAGSSAQGQVMHRYNSDGSLDSSFGTGGIVTMNFGGPIVQQANGQILAAGTIYGTNNNIALARYNSNGTLDTEFGKGFGTGGIVTTDISGSDDGAAAIALQANGQILVAGRDRKRAILWVYWNDAVALLRYNSDGSLDSSFGTGGIVTTVIGPRKDWGQAIALQPDGQILVAGSGNTGTSEEDVVLLRYQGEMLDITPAKFSFTDEASATPSTLQTSAQITITGLDAGVTVPVKITGGEYAIDANDYTENIGYVGNGQQISVRHTSATSEATTTDTILSVGGLHTSNNTRVILGTQTEDTFTSITATASSSNNSEGGGIINPAWLAALLGFRVLRRHTYKTWAEGLI